MAEIIQFPAGVVRSTVTLTSPRVESRYVAVQRISVGAKRLFWTDAWERRHGLQQKSYPPLDTWTQNTVDAIVQDSLPLLPPEATGPVTLSLDIKGPDYRGGYVSFAIRRDRWRVLITLDYRDALAAIGVLPLLETVTRREESGARQC